MPAARSPAAVLPLGLGFFSLVAQTLLFRQFFAVYEGSELGLAAFFCSWLTAVAVGGAAARGAWLRRLAQPGRFEWLPLLYLPACALQYWLIFQSRRMAGVSPYELFPLARMFAVSLLANAPVPLVTGFLFVGACSWAQAVRSAATPRVDVARIYAWECGGGFLGGLVVTALLAAAWRDESAWLLAALLLAVTVAATGARPRWLALVPAGGLLVALVLGGGRHLAEWRDRAQWSRLLPAAGCQGGFNTQEGRYVYGQYQGQFSLLAWESIAASLPDTQSAGEQVAAALSQCPAARRIAVVGAGGYAVCRVLLALPQVDQATWLNTDPGLAPKLLAVMPTELRAEDPRLAAPAQDARQYLETTADTYDLILLALPPDTTLLLNRFYTREFLQTVRERLAPDGVVGVRCQGGENYLGPELIHLGAALLNTLQGVFPNVVLKPGADTWMFASAGSNLARDPQVLQARFAAIPQAGALYPPAALPALYPTDRAQMQRDAYDAAIRGAPDLLLNTDAQPRALLYSLLFLGRHEGSAWALGDRLARLQRHGLELALALLAIYAAWRAWYLRRGRPSGASGVRPGMPVFDAGVLVFCGGGFGLILNMVLLYWFQARFGTVYLLLGLLSALYMLGMAAGSAGLLRWLSRKPAAGRGPWPAWLLPVAGLGLAMALFAGANLPAGGFIPLFLLCGAAAGGFIPLATRALAQAGRAPPAAAALVAWADYLGGAAGALWGGLFLLPVLGQASACGWLAALALMNLAPWLAQSPGAALGNTPRPDSFDRVTRASGYVLTAAAAWALLAAHWLNPPPTATPGDPPPAAAAGTVQADLQMAADELARGYDLKLESVAGDQAAVAYYSYSNRTGFVVSTRDLAPGVQGYAGPIVLGLRLDQDGTLRNLVILEHWETPDYMTRIYEWLDTLRGQNIFAADALERVDGVTGATASSDSILHTLRIAGERLAGLVTAAPAAAQPAQPPPAPKPSPVQGLVLLLWIAAALLMRRAPHRGARLAFLALSALVLGAALNLQYSTEHLLILLGGSWPAPALSASFLLVVGVPLVVLLVGNIYCSYLCPFGALQELAGAWRPAWLRGPGVRPGVARYARAIKYLLLFGVVLVFALHQDRRAVAQDILVHVFSPFPRPAVYVASGALLLAAFFYPRFYCRHLCPTGAFLALLNGAPILRRWRPRLPWPRCDYGVRSARDLDCICCDRCRTPGFNPPPLAAGTNPERLRGQERALLLLTGFMAAALVLVSLPLGRPATRTAAAVPGASKVPLSALPAPRSGVTEKTSGARPAPTTGIQSTDKPGRARKVNAALIRDRLRAGTLSDHPAMFYTVVAPAQALTNAPP